jgi:hypothetical protein
MGFYCPQFSLLLYALEMFLLFPYLRRDVLHTSTAAHACLSLLLPAAAFALLLPLSPLLTSLFATLVVFVVFVCPLFLVRIQKFKTRINGCGRATDGAPLSWSVYIHTTSFFVREMRGWGARGMQAVGRSQASAQLQQVAPHR